jgi:hypothetical protein
MPSLFSHQPKYHCVRPTTLKLKVRHSSPAIAPSLTQSIKQTYPVHWSRKSLSQAKAKMRKTSIVVLSVVIIASALANQQCEPNYSSYCCQTFLYTDPEGVHCEGSSSISLDPKQQADNSSRRVRQSLS